MRVLIQAEPMGLRHGLSCAFCSDDILRAIHTAGVVYTAGAPDVSSAPNTAGAPCAILHTGEFP